MNNYFLQITLESDTTFGRGDGVAGLIDSEVEHDEFGLPFLRGRALKGLLAEECANVLFALERQNFLKLDDLKKVADSLFGTSGSSLENDAEMNVGNAVLSDELRQAVKYAIEKGQQFTSDEVLKSLTTIRRQTAMSEKGAPKEGSLRSARTVLRNTVLMAEIDFNFLPNEKILSLLAVSAIALKRIGLGRNRGRGKVSVKLFENGNDKTSDFLTGFEKFVEQTEAK
jgi:CRISPR/Cas system CSM-associated protein Csm3 (group 7 of RAMP superfamily)